MDNRDQMEPGFFHKPDLAELKKEHENKNPVKNPSKMMAKWPRVNVPGTNRTILPGVDLLLAAGTATAMAVGTHAAIDNNSHMQDYTLIKVPSEDPNSTARTSEVQGERFVDRASLIQAETKAVMPTVPINLKENAAESIPLILDAFINEGYSSNKLLGFILANAEYESNFNYAQEEYGGEDQAEKLNYDGGIAGGGLIQLTHKYNLERMSKYLSNRFPDKYKDIDLSADPERVLEPDISAAIIVGYMREFGIDKLIDEGKFVEARKKIVGNYDEESDDYNNKITKYIIMRMNSYFEPLESLKINNELNKQLPGIINQVSNKNVQTFATNDKGIVK